MNTAFVGFDGPPALVPGELRGYRQFQLAGDGLYPTVHRVMGPWSGELQPAVCAAESGHAAPAHDCGCGLYGWYHPGDANGGFGDISGVIAARGRCILGDRGFRAAAARIEAIALPWWMRLAPRTAGRTRAMLALRYPHTRVYGSKRRMLREHPCHDVSELGIAPRSSHVRIYRRAALLLWTLGVLAFWLVALAFRGEGQDGAPALALGVLLGVVTWQALLITLVVRMSSPRRRH